jgi:hypothetical protein
MDEPKRLTSGDGELAGMLSLAERDVLQEERVDRVRAGLRAAGVVGGTAGATKFFGSATVKVVGVLLLGGVLTAFAVHHVHSTPTTIPASTLTPTPTPTLTPTPEPIPTPTPTPSPTPHPNPSPSPPVLRVAPVKSAVPVATAPSPREGMLLLQARQSLATDPQHTLDLVAAHEREFPVSQLQPERDKLRREAIAAGAK